MRGEGVNGGGGGVVTRWLVSVGTVNTNSDGQSTNTEWQDMYDLGQSRRAEYERYSTHRSRPEQPISPSRNKQPAKQPPPLLLLPQR
jgi:hypothetical protein